MKLFESIDQLNAAVRIHKRNHKLSDTERAVLDVLAQYSCKDVGKSWLAKSKIAALVGKSRRTIIRVCNKLELLGIIRQFERKRETGDRRQTSNLIVIQPANDEMSHDLADVTPACHTEETPPRNSINNNTLATNGALKRSIPAELYNALKPYFNDDDMYKTVGILYRAKATINREILFEDHAPDYLDAFKSVVFSYKRGKVRNLFACLYGAWRQVTLEIKRRLTVVNSDMFYDWLNC